MKHKKLVAWSFALSAALAATASSPVLAQAKEIKIGVVYDLTGPLAAGGSNASYLGTKYAIDIINERGGVEGVKIKPIYVDAQSKPEVAINETERLINQEKVDLIMGVFSSAHCVPMAQKADAAKKFMWANVCVASAVFKDKKLQYVFRPQVHSDQFGEASCAFLNEQTKAKLGKDAKDLKVAIIYEDGPYGAGVASGNESSCKGYGMQVVLKEGYAATSPDLSPLVTKLKRARPRHCRNRIGCCQPREAIVCAARVRRELGSCRTIRHSLVDCGGAVLRGHSADHGHRRQCEGQSDNQAKDEDNHGGFDTPKG